MTTLPVPPLLLLICILSFNAVTRSSALVPDNETFVYFNNGDLGIYINEYSADYRALDLFTSPFQLAFLNSSADVFYLAIRMGTTKSESVKRWVWEANRGRPVRDNGTLTFGKDGNLVLANPGGSVVWSTDTANKGVVGIKITEQGNLVLYDANGRYVWQSFDHPTDTLMVGAALRAGGPTKLVSRRSASDGSSGIYSLVLEPKGLNFYVNNIRYGTLLENSGTLTEATFTSVAAVSNSSFHELSLDANTYTQPLLSTKYDSHLSFLRLDIDGNLRIYTYYDPVFEQSWDVSFEMFSDRFGLLDGCALPSKCGSFGLCKNEMCVACPSPKGLMGWDEGCAPPKLGKCGNGAAGYYKVAGVESPVSVYNKGEGVMKVAECKRRCSADCKCAGFLYQEETSKCWLAPLLGTLNSVSKSSHVAYVKFFPK